MRGEGQQELVHVADETWIAAPPARVGEVVADPALWERFWPGLAPRLVEARGIEGVRLAVEQPPGERSRGWHGSAELYVHPEFEGVLLFQFLRLDPAPGHRVSARQVRLEQRRRSAVGLAASWALKDDLEARSAGAGGHRR